MKDSLQDGFVSNKHFSSVILSELTMKAKKSIL